MGSRQPPQRFECSGEVTNNACPNLALPEAADYLFSSIEDGLATTPELKPQGLNLTNLKQEQIDWLLSRGVLPSALKQPSPIMTCRGERARDGRFDENHEGPQWFVFEEQCDLVFWNPATGEIAADTGRAFALGEDIIYNPATTAFDCWLNLYSDPLEWLCHTRKGIVVIKHGWAFDKLRDVLRIAVVEAMLPAYRKMMKPPHMPQLAVIPNSARKIA